MARIYERDTQALFLRWLRDGPEFASLLTRIATGDAAPQTKRPDVRTQCRQLRGAGSTDLFLAYEDGPVLLIENKIDAPYRLAPAKDGQPERYRATVKSYRARGVHAFSVLLAPQAYLSRCEQAEMFDAQVPYERLAAAASGEDRSLLESAILQAEQPFGGPAADADFRSAVQQLTLTRYPALSVAPETHAAAAGVMRFILDEARTWRMRYPHPPPKLILQYKGRMGFAATQILLMDMAHLWDHAWPRSPHSLADIGGRFRPVGGALGFVIDTPPLDPRRCFGAQLGDIVEALEAALRLQAWWEETADEILEWLALELFVVNDANGV